MLKSWVIPFLERIRAENFYFFKFKALFGYKLGLKN